MPQWTSSNATWDGSIRIPPNQSIAITFTVPFRFADYNTSGGDMNDEKLNVFAGRRLKDIDGLTFFDYSSKYKVQMAKNWNTPKKQDTNSTGWFLPTRVISSNKVAACEQATTLAEHCARANISTTSAPGARYGDWPGKLRELSAPPPGYALDPTPDTCTIAAEWQNYCKAKVK